VAVSESWGPGGERELSLVALLEAGAGSGSVLQQVVEGRGGRTGWRWESAGLSPLARAETARLGEELKRHLLLAVGDAPAADPPSLRRQPAAGARR
jgi:hypothetical protein